MKLEIVCHRVNVNIDKEFRVVPVLVVMELVVFVSDNFYSVLLDHSSIFYSCSPPHQLWLLVEMSSERTGRTLLVRNIRISTRAQEVVN